jgi:ubiquitin C-terminal hydrolase
MSTIRTLGSIFSDIVHKTHGESLDPEVSEILKMCPSLRDDNMKQDAFVFMQAFLTALCEELGYQSYFARLFRGSVSARVECMNCGNFRLTEEGFLTISLPILDRRGISLSDCLEAYTARENLHNANLWTCEDCQFYVSSSRELHFKSLPATLLIHFKRFADSTLKLKTLVEYPLDLDMRKFMPESTEENLNYRLCGLIRHKGKGLPGRYFGYMRNWTTGEWFEYAEGKVSRAPEAKLVNQDAYILVYGLKQEGEDR